MAVYRKWNTQLRPKNAQTFSKSGETWLSWVDSKGKKREGRLSADGKKVLVQSSLWTAQYRTGDGSLKESATGCRSKSGALRVLADLESTAEKVRSGVLTQAESNVAEWQTHALDRHLEDFLAHLAASGVTTRHLGDRRVQLNRIFQECEFKKLRDLNREAFERWINQQTKSNTAKGRSKTTMSAARRNVYQSALVGFANWAVNAKRLSSSPFAGMKKANEQADRRHVRRSLTEFEMNLVLDAARRRPLEGALKGWRGGEMSAETRREFERIGRERALIYKTLLLTGLRRGELASITVGAVRLDLASPVITLHAKDEKSRRGANIPLRSDLAEELRVWLEDLLKEHRLACKKEGSPIPVRLPVEHLLFNVPVRLARSLDLDLAFVNIDKHDEYGRVIDVHGLRMTFCTHLFKAGVPLRTVQAAMRHSDPKLTTNIYGDATLLDLEGAIDSLPVLSAGTCVQPAQNTQQNRPDSSKNEPTSHVVNNVVNPGDSGHFGSVPVLEVKVVGTGEPRIIDLNNPNVYRVIRVLTALDAIRKEWHPQGDSNPCRRRERAVS